MYRDTTELPETVNCIKIVDDKTLIVYTDTATTIFKTQGNKYYATENYDPNTPSTETVCYTLSDAQTIPSNYDFVAPFYHILAIASIIFIVWASYKLIVYPFFRKKA